MIQTGPWIRLRSGLNRAPHGPSCGPWVWPKLWAFNMAQAVGQQVLSLLLLSTLYRIEEIMSKESSGWDEDAFWRKLILPQEDRRTPWEGKGYRWFRSSNI